jgi:putative toxin-antitoxin system antitoxin component (TIGR02293 family)
VKTPKKNPPVSKTKRNTPKKATYNAGNDSIQPIVLNEVSAPPYELSPYQKIYKIKSGISKKELTSIKEAARLDYDTLAQLLSVARATLIHKKDHEKFNLNVSEKILALADLYSYGYEVFDDVDKFNDWMKEPNLALDNKLPLDLADTMTGIEELKHLIGRIDYGIFS